MVCVCERDALWLRRVSAEKTLKSVYTQPITQLVRLIDAGNWRVWGRGGEKYTNMGQWCGWGFEGSFESHWWSMETNCVNPLLTFATNIDSRTTFHIWHKYLMKIYGKDSVVTDTSGYTYIHIRFNSEFSCVCVRLLSARLVSQSVSQSFRLSCRTIFAPSAKILPANGNGIRLVFHSMEMIFMVIVWKTFNTNTNINIMIIITILIIIDIWPLTWPILGASLASFP